MKNKKHTILQHVVMILVSSVFLIPNFVFAQAEGLSLTVTPPLFQFTLSPGESWASSVKIVNGNSYDIEVYATPINFVSVGEGGKGKYIPLSEEDNASSSHSLAGWIDITKDPIFIPKGKSKRVPFFVVAPKNAEPGGHYASILIGTNPAGEKDVAQMKISTLISTLLFASVSGDIIEEGRIREFSTEKILYETPEANFKLRFENIGNVHLLPRGNIVIYNMWGKERGRIDVNKDVNFGNVFPGSIRNFSFTWKGENNFYDIGRYKAISTLSYGVGERQSDFSILYFWVIPVKPLLWIGGAFLLFVLFIFLSIRRYVKHALKIQTELLMGESPSKDIGLKQAQKQITKNVAAAEKQKQVQKVVTPMQVLKQPVIQGAVDLRRASSTRGIKHEDESLSTKELLIKYKTFVVFSGLFLVCLVIAVFFLKQVMVDERDFDIQIQNNTNKTIDTDETLEI